MIGSSANGNVVGSTRNGELIKCFRGFTGLVERWFVTRKGETSLSTWVGAGGDGGGGPRFSFSAFMPGSFLCTMTGGGLVGFSR